MRRYRLGFAGSSGGVMSFLWQCCSMLVQNDSDLDFKTPPGQCAGAGWASLAPLVSNSFLQTNSMPPCRTAENLNCRPQFG